MTRFAWLPDFLRDSLVSLRSKHRRSADQKKMAQQLSFQPAKKIVVGAGGTRFEGWIPTEQHVLNLLVESDWIRYFKKDSLDAILAEHVWEHLTPEESILAARNCFSFLKPRGYLRVAVPDGYHPDPGYMERVRPGGIGSGADDHKVLYTYKTFCDIFVSAGFEVSLLEYFDEFGEFHHNEWSPVDGFIERSMRFDSRNQDGNLNYTSIILDATKTFDQNG